MHVHNWLISPYDLNDNLITKGGKDISIDIFIVFLRQLVHPRVPRAWKCASWTSKGSVAPQIGLRCIWKQRVVPHAEFPAFSVGENFSPATAGHMTIIPMRSAASPGGSQSEPLFTRAF
jgi:hypothetical protein